MMRHGIRLAAGAFALLMAAASVAPPVTVTAAGSVVPDLSPRAGRSAQDTVAAATLAPTAIATGVGLSCALLSDRTVQCWGRNDYGQLGNGTSDFEPHPRPVAVSGISTGRAIATGGNHTCVVLADRTVRCWGSGDHGALGNGTITDRLTPVAVPGISTARAIAARSFHTCALLADRTVRCWGENDDGLLGDGTTTERHTPVTVSGISTATAIATGGHHTCAVLADGTVRCWGSNEYGQLGSGTSDSDPHPSPVVVSGISTAWAIAAGDSHTCAVLAGGTVRCWGANWYGALGDGTTTNRSTPVAVPGLYVGPSIAAGAYNTCAHAGDSTIRCWGSNDHGGLGDGTTTERHIPVAVSGVSTAVRFDTGGNHTCASLSDGSARCWGSNEYGELGDGTTTTRLTPVVVNPSSSPFTDMTWTPFKPDIEWVYTAGITSGCTATAYCPDGYVTREQMASFLARALKLTGTAPDAFTDDEASPHEPNINLVAKAGIATGCSATKYCPAALVSREQMASFLARALKLAGSAPDAFTDDEQSIHEPNINLVAKAGVATGCGAGKYCPTQNVTRGQMAAFLHRAFGP